MVVGLTAEMVKTWSEGHRVEERWTPVTDGYPPLGTRVMVYFARELEPYMDVWRYDGVNQYFAARTRAPRHQCVTHWRYLPAPPMEVGSGK